MLYASVLLVSLLLKQCFCEDLLFETSNQHREIHNNLYDVVDEIHMKSQNVAEVGTEDVVINVNTTIPLNHVEEYFMSFNQDSPRFVTKLMLNTSWIKLQMLVRAFSPSLFRIGGSTADWRWLDKPQSVLRAAGLKPFVDTFTKETLLKLVNFTRSAGSRLLFDLNLQLRFGRQWNPGNFIDLLQYCTSENICDIDWELGNEPSSYRSLGQMVLTEQQIAEDYGIFYRVLRAYPCFNKSIMVGPDVVSVRPGSKGLRIIRTIADNVGDHMRAITFHHYYFRGDTADYTSYLNPAYFHNLEEAIYLVQSEVAASKHPKIPVWIGETNDAWHAGTVNVSDRFVACFLWMDKLGVSAQRGVGVVMHHTVIGQNGLLDLNLNPTPHYWLSLLHRQLVGTVVLHTELVEAVTTLRVYAHCTRAGGWYKAGAVTVFGLNVSPTDTTHLVFTDSVLHQQPIDVYLLTPYDGILSKYVVLNGRQRLMMLGDTQLPTFTPVHFEPGSKVILPPLSFGFFVFPTANVKICAQ